MAWHLVELRGEYTKQSYYAFSSAGDRSATRLHLLQSYKASEAISSDFSLASANEKEDDVEIKWHIINSNLSIIIRLNELK